MTWQLLPGTTLESAKVEGAMWTRHTTEGAEFMRLPCHIVTNLGYIPSPYMAAILIELMGWAE